MARLARPTVGAALVTAVVEALTTAPARCGTTRVLAVDGRSGAGKSTLVAAVTAALAAPVVRMDELYPGWDGLAAGTGRLADEVLGPIAAGVPAVYRRWDWMRSRPGRRVEVAPGPILVVDGVGSGAAAVRPWLSLLVWLDAPPDLRRDEALRRDGAAYARQWERWAAQEERYGRCDRPADAAGLRLARDAGGLRVVSPRCSPR